ncbi:AEC family transporter [Corticibacter populi]|uniref:AEC family transporter n=1 Tax=Corticibacter populi TaxID=1550736 RepID=A0A3M6QRY7_9BURK|nr:AEC family transporter [Corticibacter populi]RMX05815.1 AEC family transporter [Corticibacter populi]RZS30873.1 hypothetical protein EV687_3071 [Corticibacter populi]
MFGYVLPVFLVIAVGVAIKRHPRAPAGLFPALEWFSFYIAFPALLFLRTAQLQLGANAVSTLALVTLLPTALILVVTLAGLRLARRLPNPARSSVIQGATRPSTYYGLAVAALIFPPEIASLVMLALAICLPAVNVIAVIALAWWGDQQVSPQRIARMLAQNPIIVATVAGALWNISGLGLATPLANALEILAGVAMGLGLICVGGGLDFRPEGAHPQAMAWTIALKLMGLPALTWLLCLWLGVHPMVTTAACFYAALPTAPNAYIMARQMGGDARLMAALITLQTLLSMLTLPLWMHWLQFTPASGA